MTKILFCLMALLPLTSFGSQPEKMYHFRSDQHSIEELVDFLKEKQGSGRFYNCQLDIQIRDDIFKCDSGLCDQIVLLMAKDRRFKKPSDILSLVVPREQMQAEKDKYSSSQRLKFSNRFEVRGNRYHYSVSLERNSQNKWTYFELRRLAKNADGKVFDQRTICQPEFE